MRVLGEESGIIFAAPKVKNSYVYLILTSVHGCIMDAGKCLTRQAAQCSNDHVPRHFGQCFFARCAPRDCCKYLALPHLPADNSCKISDAVRTCVLTGQGRVQFWPLLIAPVPSRLCRMPFCDQFSVTSSIDLVKTASDA